MTPRDYLYKLKEEIRSLWHYPPCDLDKNPEVDYDLYWKARRQKNTGLTSWQKQRADWILKHIESGSTVLDLGCGQGHFLKYLHDKAGIKGIGVDCVADIFEESDNENFVFIEKDINDMATLNTLPEVDYVIASEILEHLPQPEKIIQILKPKTKIAFIASFPNSGYYTHRLRLLLGRSPLQWITHPGEHLRFWTLRDTKWWLKSLGFSNFFVSTYEGWPLLNRIFPSLFGQGLIFYVKTNDKSSV